MCWLACWPLHSHSVSTYPSLTWIQRHQYAVPSVSLCLISLWKYFPTKRCFIYVMVGGDGMARHMRARKCHRVARCCSRAQQCSHTGGLAASGDEWVMGEWALAVREEAGKDSRRGSMHKGMTQQDSLQQVIGCKKDSAGNVASLLARLGLAMLQNLGFSPALWRAALPE